MKAFVTNQPVIVADVTIADDFNYVEQSYICAKVYSECKLKI